MRYFSINKWVFALLGLPLFLMADNSLWFRTCNEINDIVRDSSFLYCAGGAGIWKIDLAADIIEEITIRDGLPEIPVRSCVLTSQGELIFACDHYLVRLSSSGEPENQSFANPDWEMVHFLREDSRGNLWLGTNRGLFQIQGNETERKSNLAIPISSFSENGNGTLLFTGSFGYYISKDGDSLEYFPYVTEGAEGQRITAGALGADGGIFLASNAGAWMPPFVYHVEGGVVDTIPLGINICGVNEMVCLDNGELWCAFYLSKPEIYGEQRPCLGILKEGNFLYYDLAPFWNIKKMVVDSDLVCLATTQGVSVTSSSEEKIYSLSETVLNNHIYCLGKDGNGAVWMGQGPDYNAANSVISGVSKYYPQREEWEVFHHPYGVKSLECLNSEVYFVDFQNELYGVKNGKIGKEDFPNYFYDIETGMDGDLYGMSSSSVYHRKDGVWGKMDMGEQIIKGLYHNCMDFSVRSGDDLIVGTNMGLFEYADGNLYSSFTCIGEVDDICFTAVYVHGDSLSYAGTNSGVIYRGKKGEWENISPDGLGVNAPVSSFGFDENNTLYVSTLGGGIYFRTGEEWAKWDTVNSSLKSNVVSQIEINGGMVYAATRGEGLCVLEQAPAVSVAEGDRELSPRLSVSCYPNPFSCSITFSQKGSDEADVRKIEIYDILGRCVYSGGERGGMKFPLSWDGRNSRGESLPNGTYLVSIKTFQGDVHRLITKLN